ncbi:MAG: 2-dehydro-3-deoxygalactonokinase [Rhodobacteraceae bacterium]|nr:2-dehydro-3-deoxygalactonokinase [Paracoccaceae bacterium]
MNWVAIDWGTTNVRFWLMSGKGELLSSKNSPMGMNLIPRDQYENHIVEMVGEWFQPSEPIDVIACGMVGAANGWVEAKYQSIPCLPVSTEKITRVPTKSPNLEVGIIPGIASYSPNHDVMRGEETQICGFLGDYPAFEGVLCMPGTHTKWVEIKSGQVIGFKTFLTGELYDVLCKSSILRHSVNTDSWDENEFVSAVETSLKHPEEITTRLFSIRSESLLGGLQPANATSRLAGFLIGLELAGSKKYWGRNNIAIIGSKTLAQNYLKALELIGIDSRLVDSDTCTIKGLDRTRHLHVID